MIVTSRKFSKISIRCLNFADARFFYGSGQFPGNSLFLRIFALTWKRSAA